MKTTKTDELLATSRALLDVREMLAAGYLRRVREAAGVSQQAVADALGCSQPCICDYENKVTTPGVELGLRLHALIRKLEAQLVEDGRFSYENFTPVPAVVSVSV